MLDERSDSRYRSASAFPPLHDFDGHYRLVYISKYIYKEVMMTKNFAIGSASLAFVLAVAIGGFFYPYIGFAVAAVMVVAMAMSLFKPRLFCAKACPRGRALGFGLKKLSRGRPLPTTALSGGSRRALCGFMMLCVGGNIYRLFGSAAALGSFFWGLCVVSLGAGVVVGIIYKPRAWCVVCPMGTLQETIGALKK